MILLVLMMTATSLFDIQFIARKVDTLESAREQMVACREAHSMICESKTLSISKEGKLTWITLEKQYVLKETKQVEVPKWEIK